MTEFQKLLTNGRLSMVLIITALILAQTVQTKAQENETNFTSAYSVSVNTLSKQCKNDDQNASGEGEDFRRICKGFGDYSLVLSGFDYRINHAVESENFHVNLQPLGEEEGSEAGKYVRADLYDHRLGNKIEWRLADGKPFAVIVRVMFYKNIGSVKTFQIPKNKAAEFVFVRGLAGYENLKFDLRTTKTAYNPDEQARALSDEFYYEKNNRNPDFSSLNSTLFPAN